jgi:uncharacterized protein YecE (DUF72 family)
VPVERLRIGTAGWSIPRAAASTFPGDGTHLQRYARVFPAAEINSSFHRPHAERTYRRWAESTPPWFRFAVKLPRAITHEGGLRGQEERLHQFLAESSGLGDRRGPLLIQLPPKFAFDRGVVESFLDLLRRSYGGPIACEPRHATWFSEEADVLLRGWSVARAAADPASARLHGSPRKYWSKYDGSFIAHLAGVLRTAPPDAATWCIFDNTASGAAIEDALALQSSVAERVPER